MFSFLPSVDDVRDWWGAPSGKTKKKRNESNESDTRRAAFKLLRPSVSSDGEGKRPTSSFILISLFFNTTDKGKESHALGHPAVQQFRVVDIGIEEELLLLGRNMKLAPSDRILRQQPGRPITCSFSFLFLFFFTAIVWFSGVKT